MCLFYAVIKLIMYFLKIISGFNDTVIINTYNLLNFCFCFISMDNNISSWWLISPPAPSWISAPSWVWAPWTFRGSLGTLPQGSGSPAPSSWPGSPCSTSHWTRRSSAHRASCKEQRGHLSGETDTISLYQQRHLRNTFAHWRHIGQGSNLVFDGVGDNHDVGDVSETGPELTLSWPRIVTLTLTLAPAAGHPSQVGSSSGQIMRKQWQ